MRQLKMPFVSCIRPARSRRHSKACISHLRRLRLCCIRRHSSRMPALGSFHSALRQSTVLARIRRKRNCPGTNSRYRCLSYIPVLYHVHNCMRHRITASAKTATPIASVFLERNDLSRRITPMLTEMREHREIASLFLGMRWE